ncbi:hypothetical protein [Streptomyces coeruleorubidus]|uniref:hypothetical protein n=1 Tax=Streptomyces coeruleorubidus TaxID=116188 RepID=UPI0036493207
MEWMDAVRALAEDPLVGLAVGKGVWGIARRVQRGRDSVAACSEAGPATTVRNVEGTEIAVTTTRTTERASSSRTACSRAWATSGCGRHPAAE